MVKKKKKEWIVGHETKVGVLQPDHGGPLAIRIRPEFDISACNSAGVFFLRASLPTGRALLDSKVHARNGIVLGVSRSVHLHAAHRYLRVKMCLRS